MINHYINYIFPIPYNLILTRTLSFLLKEQLPTGMNKKPE